MTRLARDPGFVSRVNTWNIDIDRSLNPLIPAPRWHLVPTPIAHFLGYRDGPVRPLGNVVWAFWSMLGVFCGVALVASVSERVPSFQSRDTPAIIGSFGAAAVIQFCAIESPFAQPRNAFISQMFACLIGVGISKLFALNANAESYLSLGGALACGLTTVAMLLTNTIHPPAGATALLAVTNSETSQLGWFLFPVMILGITLMQVAALIINNIPARYPLYWWTPQPLFRPRHDVEGYQKKGFDEPSQCEDEDSVADMPQRLVIQKGKVQVPDRVFVSPEERSMLDKISERM
ncbi:hypothetical protein N7495_001035 [Penicillium taxi]|uniref:uncharacterized protein n=1 Tax=Penicillium taxi TaxID=168475 RepID=UPI002545A48F|nr:uncharacterized protein N7495_001035 [Penicillium taxi]KAJ5908353.1 hypothetical protein N7495_001035 [Penicillium taxi]